MKYCGVVTDESWKVSMLKLSSIQRNSILQKENKKHDWKYLEGLDFVYSVGRLPRIYLDEHIKKYFKKVVAIRK